MEPYEVIIIGGGLAGLTAAIHLATENYRILVCEKERYPHHKVCGEYVSNEVLPYLESLNITVQNLAPARIDTLQISSATGKWLKSKLPLGGFGTSRYDFDHLLYQKAVASGVSFVFEAVATVHFHSDVFELVTDTGTTLMSKMVIGAYGKRSSLDKGLNRGFVHKKSPWLGVKAHYKLDAWPDNLVALHNFRGGYAGLSKTGSDTVNFCYLASYDSFKREKNIEDFNAKVLAKNPFLATFLEEAQPMFEEPLTIAQISFERKQAVENHMLMCGDTAGLIHPLCGNGMAMAIHSAKIASECINDYFKNENKSRAQLEVAYSKRWNTAFKRRLWMGRQLQSLFLNEKWTHWAISLAIRSPKMMETLIRNTHGQALNS